MRMRLIKPGIFVLSPLFAFGCSPQAIQQMQRDHDRRMEQFAYAHAERQKAWESIWKRGSNQSDSDPARTRQKAWESIWKFGSKQGDSDPARTRQTRERNTGWSHFGAAPPPPGEPRAEPERSAWDEFWGIDDSEPAADPEKPPKIRRAGTGEFQEWTIECNAYAGPQRREMAERMAKLLAEVPEIDGEQIRVQHTDENSRVLYGTYPLEYVYSDAKKQGEAVIEIDDKIRGDVDFIRKLAVGDAHPFLQARPIEKPRPMEGRPEWDLRNAHGTYTLHVGVTYATPTLENYKEAALQWVQVLRESGHEAYYYHDPDAARVSICVGTFGPDAVKERMNEETGVTEHVYTEAVNALRAKDESFQYNLENGHIVYRHVMNRETKRKERIPNLSFLVKIPMKGGRLSGGGDDHRYRSGQPPRPARARR